MDLAVLCGALKATQQPDGEARKEAEALLDKAAEGQPDQLVGALCQLLQASPSDVADALRQEATVILRQLVEGLPTRKSVWESLQAGTKTAAREQVLLSVKNDPSGPVRRGAGQVVSAIVNEAAEDMQEIQKDWPELLRTLAQFTTSACEAPVRVVALGILRDIATVVGEGLFEDDNRKSSVSMLASTLSDGAPEVRAAGAQLSLALIEVVQVQSLTGMSAGEEAAPFVQIMPELVRVIQGFANNLIEEPLKDTLEVLIQAAEAEAPFFKESGCLKDLSETLIKIASAGAEAFAAEEVRHSAMEAVMALAMNLATEVSQPDGLPLLEALLLLNIQWMTEVEEDVEMWVKEGKEKDEDDCDDDAVGIGEENLDRIGENFEEDVFMPILFKVIRASLSRPDATWKTTRSCIMALAQVVEHLEGEEYVDQCVEFVLTYPEHEHPRVRYAAFWAMSQICYDQSPHVQDTFCERLLPAIVTGINDSNVRVATSAVSAFVACGEELESDDLEECIDDLLMRLFNRLHEGEAQALQEQCLCGIAVIAEVGEELFTPYYNQVMPMLKQVIAACTREEQRSLHGKALGCVAMIGSAVGKEIFMQDAKEVMDAMLPLARDGLDADDPRREAWHEAAGKIAETLGKDFKPYVSALLPSIFKVLQQKPSEGHAEDIDDDDSDDEQLRLLGLKTSVLDEMEEALELMDTLIEALEEEFCEFLPDTCRTLLAMLDTTLSEALREKVFGTWQCLAGSARTAVTQGRMDVSNLRELVTEFLRKTIGAMMTAAGNADKVDEEVCGKLQSQAAGLAGVVKKAGEGVLTKDCVKDVATLIMQMLDKIPCTTVEPGIHRRRGGPAPEEDSDGEEKEVEDDTPMTTQSVRFTLTEVAGALMRSNREEFSEVALPTYMELVKSLVKQDRSESDRCLGFYMADDAVAILGEKSVPYWDGFMNEAFVGMLDKCAVVRQYATSTIGNGASQAVFAAVAPAAASQIHKVLSKQGERHRRRRAVKSDAFQVALAVDACIRALGQICEHQEQQLGADAAAAWSLWVSNLPIKYNLDAGKAAHTQLIELVMRSHPVLTNPSSFPSVLAVFADVYRSKFSSSDVDKKLAEAVASIPEATLKSMCASFPERRQKKIEQMVKKAKAVDEDP